MAGASGKKLDETYRLAWLRGLKTTYYLRTIGATHAEKSTSTRTGQLNSVSSDMGVSTAAMPEADGKALHAQARRRGIRRLRSLPVTHHTKSTGEDQHAGVG